MSLEEGRAVRLYVLAGVAFVVAFACAPCPCEEPHEREAGVTVRAPALPPLEPDGTFTPALPPCSRVSVLPFDGGAWVVPLPCRPYDRMRDLADPGPDLSGR